jgi:hypothetical protein
VVLRHLPKASDIPSESEARAGDAEQLHSCCLQSTDVISHFPGRREVIPNDDAPVILAALEQIQFNRSHILLQRSSFCTLLE